jgi:pimeloyl-ACP methyl ester carboxylesterase
MVHTHQTAPTQFVEANGIRFAYRRFGNAAGIPLVFNQHFTGTMDHWDPAVTDGLAKEARGSWRRQVVRVVIAQSINSAALTERGV